MFLLIRLCFFEGIEVITNQIITSKNVAINCKISLSQFGLFSYAGAPKWVSDIV